MSKPKSKAYSLMGMFSGDNNHWSRRVQLDDCTCVVGMDRVKGNYWHGYVLVGGRRVWEDRVDGTAGIGTLLRLAGILED